MTTDDLTGQMTGLTGELREAFGEDLLSVVLYGSAARSDHQGSGSDLNIVVVLRDIGLESLERGTRPTRAWEAKGNRPLLFFSPEWISRSCDVFPLEFLDIVAWHRVIHGPDPFAGLVVSSENLRLQCESEIKTKLIHLRTGYIAFHEDAGQLARLMAASFAPIVTLCRGVLRLAGREVPSTAHEVIRLGAELCGFDPAPFDDVAAVKRGGPAAASLGMKALFKNYCAQVEAMARAVDAGLPANGAKR
ncbi:MAG TPA: nucleotidyltransferase domain-containing protein [Candidatus Polarisedimenticolia bacterium]|jgi:predicted nucleotidyltransferase